jgi:hypothetical protein
MYKKMVVILLGLIFTCHAMDISEKERILELLDQTATLNQLSKEISFLLIAGKIDVQYAFSLAMQQLIQQKMLQEITFDALTQTDFSISQFFMEMSQQWPDFKKQLYEKLLGEYYYKCHISMIISSDKYSEYLRGRLQYIQNVLQSNKWLHQPFEICEIKKRRQAHGQRQDPIQVH